VAFRRPLGRALDWPAGRPLRLVMFRLNIYERLVMPRRFQEQRARERRGGAITGVGCGA